MWIIWSTLLHKSHKLWSYTDFFFFFFCCLSCLFPVYFLLRLEHNCKLIWSQLTTLFLVLTLKTWTITLYVCFLPSHSSSNLESLCLISNFRCKHTEQLSEVEHSNEHVYFPLVLTLPLIQNRLDEEETSRTKQEVPKSHHQQSSWSIDITSLFLAEIMNYSLCTVLLHLGNAVKIQQAQRYTCTKAEFV